MSYSSGSTCSNPSLRTLGHCREDKMGFKVARYRRVQEGETAMYGLGKNVRVVDFEWNMGHYDVPSRENGLYPWKISRNRHRWLPAANW